MAKQKEDPLPSIPEEDEQVPGNVYCNAIYHVSSFTTVIIIYLFIKVRQGIMSLYETE